jgi:hypothetical protein
MLEGGFGFSEHSGDFFRRALPLTSVRREWVAADYFLGDNNWFAPLPPPGANV